MKQRKLKLSEIVGRGYASFWNSKQRYVVCKGGRGSKKSKTSALKLIVNLMAHKEANALVIRRYERTLRNSCYSDLVWAVHRLGVEEYWDFKVSPLEITHKLTGQKILFRGFDDAQKITSISVPTGVLCWVWIDEAYQIEDENEFNKLDLSIRGQLPDGLWKQFILTLNPWSERWWGKKRFFDRFRLGSIALNFFSFKSFSFNLFGDFSVSKTTNKKTASNVDFLFTLINETSDKCRRVSKAKVETVKRLTFFVFIQRVKIKFKLDYIFVNRSSR